MKVVLNIKSQSLALAEKVLKNQDCLIGMCMNALSISLFYLPFSNDLHKHISFLRFD